MVRPFKSESGYSLTEVLLSTALGGIVLAGVFDLYVSSSNSILGQTNEVQMQAETKSAMDFMVRELRLMYGAPTISTTLTTNDTITFTRVEDSGYSTGGNTASTLWDTTKSWQTDAFAPTANGAHSVYIYVGQGSGEVHPIKSNTATTLTLADTDAWTTLPDTSSLYYIYRTKSFTQQSDNTLRYQIGSGSYKLLASNVTALTFAITPTDAAGVDITLTSRTSTVDPRLRTYKTFTLTDTARRRN